MGDSKAIKRKLATVITAMALAYVQPLAAQDGNLLSNPDFEYDPPGQNHTINGWQPYGGTAYNETDAAIAHGGSNYFKVFQAFNGQVNYSGIYQDYISGPGASYTAGGWAFTANGDVIAGQNVAWLEITFRDAPGNTLALYRSAEITTNVVSAGGFPRNGWSYLAVTNQFNTGTFTRTGSTNRLVAPAGTVYVRCQIVFQGDANYSNGSMYFDDLKLLQTDSSRYGGMNIVWNDEFDGTVIKNKIWTYDTGNGGWGNNELENYTSRSSNAYVSNGLLHIVAQHESLGGSSFTSARLKSQGLFSFKYGRVEWRAQAPSGVGLWPALWLLGANINSVSWPSCGEIDVLENNGTGEFCQGSVHYGGDGTAYYNFNTGSSITNFHTYTLDWTTNALLFYVDGHLYETRTGWNSPYGPAPYPFNQPFFMIMNLAVGGNYVDNPSISAITSATSFPQQLLVDYVRIYSLTDPLRISMTRSGPNLVLNWPANIVCRLEIQTNISNLASGTNWNVVATTTNSYQVDTAIGAGAFYRLVTP